NSASRESGEQRIRRAENSASREFLGITKRVRYRLNCGRQSESSWRSNCCLTSLNRYHSRSGNQDTPSTQNRAPTGGKDQQL
ncbi:MAG: hypothetical protein L7U72_13775, partial [Rubripirellula sp.]|nr:hypothetical protein [Rubripirellula sp.]